MPPGANKAAAIKAAAFVRLRGAGETQNEIFSVI